MLEVYPLIPEGKWDWFCLDKVIYHGKDLTLLYDKTEKNMAGEKAFLYMPTASNCTMANELKPVLTKLS